MSPKPRKLVKLDILQNAILNSANFAIIATDANGIIQLFNPGAERMLGYDGIDLVNKKTPAEFHDSQEMVARAEELSAEFATAIAPGFNALAYKASRGIADNYDLTLIRKNGSRFPAAVSITALLDPGTEIIGYLLIVTDYSAEAAMFAAEQKKERMKDEFVATVSHELRTPLTSITGALGLLTGGAAGKLPDPGSRLLAIAHTNSLRLVRLLNDILDIEKMEAGKVVFDFQCVEVQALVEQAIEENYKFAESCDVRLRFAPTSTPLKCARTPTGSSRSSPICSRMPSSSRHPVEKWSSWWRCEMRPSTFRCKTMALVFPLNSDLAFSRSLRRPTPRTPAKGAAPASG